MTEFEYFSAMIAVILALGVTHILGQIGRVAQHPNLARLYWIHTIWVILVLLFHFAAWWNIWELRDSLRFGYLGFLYILIGPTALYLGARVLAPRLRDSEVVDLEIHYYAVHRMFFSLIAVFGIWPPLMAIFLNGTTSLMGVIEHSALLVPVIACAVSPNRRLHVFVVLLTSTLFFFIASTGLA